VQVVRNIGLDGKKSRQRKWLAISWMMFTKSLHTKWLELTISIHLKTGCLGYQENIVFFPGDSIRDLFGMVSENATSN